MPLSEEKREQFKLEILAQHDLLNRNRDWFRKQIKKLDNAYRLRLEKSRKEMEELKKKIQQEKER